MYLNIFTLLFFVANLMIFALFCYVLSTYIQSQSLRWFAFGTLVLGGFLLAPLLYYYVAPQLSNNIVVGLSPSNFLGFIGLFYTIEIRWGLLSFTILNVLACLGVTYFLIYSYSCSSKSINFNATAIAFGGGLQPYCWIRLKLQ